MYYNTINLLNLARLLADLVILLLVVFHYQRLDGMELLPSFLHLRLLVHIDQVIIIIILHENGFEVVNSSEIIIEIMNEDANGLFFVVDYIVFVLIVF